MKREDAERTITEYLRPVYGFALRRCRTTEDAEDLSQEIILRAFRALLKREDIGDVGKFIWTVAHNSLANYYRETARLVVGVPIDDVAELIADTDNTGGDADIERRAAISRLGREIAYLSKTQRQILIAYYFENRKQADIAKSLGIPLGTVKWHLFEAKKELKRGIDKMRKSSELKFNPIKFRALGINGSATKSPNDVFRSALTQNICYCVKDTAKTVNEIADDIGVSPVYVEAEAEFLEEQCFLLERNGRYIANFIIDEPTEELLVMRDRMYKRAADIFANELYDELTSSGILDDVDIMCRQTDGPVTLSSSPRADMNFILWTLIPYIAAWSGEALIEENVSFEEAATVRPDGGNYILHATVNDERLRLPDDYVVMRNWCGPMWNMIGKTMLWQLDSEWSGREEGRGILIAEESARTISLYEREKGEQLSRDEYAWLAERGYVKTNGECGGLFKSAWQIVILKKEINERLLAVGDRIKRAHMAELDELKAPYVKAVLDATPEHVRLMREYELQQLFHSHGMFLLHCISALMRVGKLRLPTAGQKKALSTLIVDGEG